MAFRGLFIGVDRYASDEINELTCAKRDAVALEALFADTFGGSETSLLVDDQATRAEIERAFQSLAASEPGDTVVVSFSGHGSETHELITHDADPNDLPSTAIPLDLLTEWFTRIPAKRLILLLDCCFSGGAGAKVLQVDLKQRSMQSAEARLRAMAGEGRLIVTASAADEPAWENQRTGHGFFTHFLIEAMRGAEEVVAAGRLPVLRLIEYVTRRVVDAAQQFGHSQSPTIRGSVDGEMVWPVFEPGPRFFAAFPDCSNAVASEDVSSLAAFGIPTEIIEGWRSSGVTSLKPLQLDAVNDFGVLRGEHLMVVAPTSSGKTMVGEMAAIKAVADRKRALFLMPMKALVADKLRHFEATYGDAGIRTIEATGETDDLTPLLRGQYDVALLTYEKFASIALTFPHVLEQVGVVVVDEMQMIADETRGANLEFLVTLILMRRREGVEPQLIALSGVVGDTNEFERWIGGRLLRRPERPVPLDEGIVTHDGTRRYVDGVSCEVVEKVGFVRRLMPGKNSSQDLIIPLVRELVRAGEQVIVFRVTKGETTGCARYLANSLGLPAAKTAIERLPGGDTSQAGSALAQVLHGGVAFHTSDLGREERRIIEEEFRREGSGLRVIAATTTLAMGVNTPANSVVVAGLVHPVDKRPYAVATYKNLVGRAGRLGYASRGSSFLIVDGSGSTSHYWERYVTAEPEDLASRFLDNKTDLRSLVVRVLVAGGRATAEERTGMDVDEIGTFLQASFGAFRQRHAGEGHRLTADQIEWAIEQLASNGLLTVHDDGRCELEPLGRLAGESGVEVGSIIRLVDCFRGVTVDQINSPALIAAAQLTKELDGVYFPLHARSHQEAARWNGELPSRGVPVPIVRALGRDADEERVRTARMKKATAALMFCSTDEMSTIEQHLMQHTRDDVAAGAIRQTASRTSDLLGVVAKVAHELHPTLDLGDTVEKLNVRLVHGVSPAAVDLAREAGTRLERGDYRRLESAGLVDPDAALAAEDANLLACVDRDAARLIALKVASAAAVERRRRKAKTPAVDAKPFEE